MAWGQAALDLPRTLSAVREEVEESSEEVEESGDVDTDVQRVVYGGVDIHVTPGHQSSGSTTMSPCGAHSLPDVYESLMCTSLHTNSTCTHQADIEPIWSRYSRQIYKPDT